MKSVLFKNKHGYFTPDGSEYVIFNPLTPRPWVNILSNGDYGCVISQLGSGYSWKHHARLNRLTRWEQDLIKDEWGKYIYIRDHDAETFWSVGYKPTCIASHLYECRHGIGYTTISSQYHNILSELTIFVPNDEPTEIWYLKIRNFSHQKRHLGLFTYLEWSLGDANDTSKNLQKTFIETSFDKKNDLILAKKRVWQQGDGSKHAFHANWPSVGFHGCSLGVDSFTCDKEAFLGLYRGLHNPETVEKGICDNALGTWGDAISSIQSNVTVDGMSETSLVFCLGMAQSHNEAKKIAQKYRSPDNALKELQKTKDFWKKKLALMEVDTPDTAFNILTNIWYKYQAISSRLFGRTAFYETDGSFAFRDQLQDSLVFLPLDSSLSRKQILQHAAMQYDKGFVEHRWHPLLNVADGRHPADDHLWLPYIVELYLKETGDGSILKEKVAYLDLKRKDTLFIHCQKAIDYALKRRSSRGLPLISEGDWNDGLNYAGAKGKGESVWLGHFLYGVLIGFAEICKRSKYGALERKYIKEASKLKAAINKYGWDGSWFIRATSDNRKPIGSRKNSEGKIFLNAQTWAVIHHVTTEDRAHKAMAAVKKHLYSKHGPMLLSPAYIKSQDDIGDISRFSPGLRDNAGINTHAGAWTIIAECLLGQGNDAWDLYKKMCPVDCSMSEELYKTEPYVMAGHIDGQASPYAGRGSSSWYTGSSTWMFRVATDWILGIRADYDGLRVDPCIPSQWRGFKMTRTFRKHHFDITVKNPQGVCKGISKILLDGKPIEGNLIPLLGKPKKHVVDVVLG